jgi:hypothetical protein
MLFKINVPFPGEEHRYVIRRTAKISGKKNSSNCLSLSQRESRILALTVNTVNIDVNSTTGLRGDRRKRNLNGIFVHFGNKRLKNAKN